MFNILEQLCKILALNLNALKTVEKRKRGCEQIRKLMKSSMQKINNRILERLIKMYPTGNIRNYQQTCEYYLSILDPTQTLIDDFNRIIDEFLNGTIRNIILLWRASQRKNKKKFAKRQDKFRNYITDFYDKWQRQVEHANKTMTDFKKELKRISLAQP